MSVALVDFRLSDPSGMMEIMCVTGSQFDVEVGDFF